MRQYRNIVNCFFISIIFVSCSTSVSLAQENVTQDNSSLEKKSEEIKKLEKEEASTKEVIKEAQEVFKKSEEEGEIIKKEKEKLSKEAQLKAEKAEVIKKEAEILEKEAKITKSPELEKEAQKLSEEAQKLSEEALVKKDKLKIVETKENIVRRSLEDQQKQIDDLTKKLKEIRIEKTAMASLFEKVKKSVPVIIIGLIIFLSMRFVLRQIEKILSRKQVLREDDFTLRVKTLNKLINWLGTLIIFIVVISLVLENFGFSIAPLIAGAGIIGLAFGFGGQYLIRDLINGLFILVEDQYRINDVIKIGDLGGLVENINLRITTLRDLEGRVIMIPNGEIKTVINYTKGYAQALFDIGVAYKENVDNVIQVIHDIGKEMRQDSYFGRLILDNLEMFGVDDFADSAVVIKFRIKTLPIKQWEVMREFRRRLKNRFDELGIEIPFPHRTLYWGAGNKSTGESI